MTTYYILRFWKTNWGKFRRTCCIGDRPCTFRLTFHR